jgi:hypothetical protein
MTPHDEEPGLLFLACILVAMVVAYLWARCLFRPRRRR